MDGVRALTELLSGASSGELYKSYSRLLREGEKCGPQITLSLLIEFHSFFFFFFFFSLFLEREFSPICENILKKEYSARIPFFFGKKFARNRIKFFLPQIATNYLQYERVHKIFYFHTLSIAKFG